MQLMMQKRDGSTVNFSLNIQKSIRPMTDIAANDDKLINDNWQKRI